MLLRLGLGLPPSSSSGESLSVGPGGRPKTLRISFKFIRAAACPVLSPICHFKIEELIYNKHSYMCYKHLYLCYKNNYIYFILENSKSRIIIKNWNPNVTLNMPVKLLPIFREKSPN